MALKLDFLQQSSVFEETTQNLNEDRASEVTKVCERSQKIRERWKQKLKEGIKREDIKCSTCGRVSIEQVKTFSVENLLKCSTVFVVSNLKTVLFTGWF